jgi:hypothetical protein
MTQLFALKLTKAQFDQIPADERLFYFLAGQLENDINILTMFLIIAINEVRLVGQDSPRRSAALAQVVLLLKLTAGRLYEGQKMINENFSAKKFLKKYESEVSHSTVESLDKLNKYFGRKSAIELIRNKFSFHVDAVSIAEAYEKAPSDFTSTEYLSTNYAGHNLFNTSETLSIVALVGEDLQDWQKKIDDIVEEITATWVTMGVFLSGFIGVIFKKYLGVTAFPENAEITIPDEAPIDGLRLPFFCLPPRERDE